MQPPAAALANPTRHLLPLMQVLLILRFLLGFFCRGPRERGDARRPPTFQRVVRKVFGKCVRSARGGEGAGGGAGPCHWICCSVPSSLIRWEKLWRQLFRGKTHQDACCITLIKWSRPGWKTPTPPPPPPPTIPSHRMGRSMRHGGVSLCVVIAAYTGCATKACAAAHL